jgi:hypothetical protein
MDVRKVAVVVVGIVAGAVLGSCAVDKMTEPKVQLDVVGDACDPDTYQGPHRCVPDPNHVGGYIISY